MAKMIDKNICPLCGTVACILENEITSVDCPKCGKYTYDLSVYPFLIETEHRKDHILTELRKMALAESQKGAVLEIELKRYQSIEKIFLLKGGNT